MKKMQLARGVENRGGTKEEEEGSKEKMSRVEGS